MRLIAHSPLPRLAPAALAAIAQYPARYPAGPMVIIVGFAAGGDSDIEPNP